MTDDAEKPQRPRVEPEIIPPGGAGAQSDWRRAPRSGAPYGQAYTTHRIYVRRIGPFGIALAMLVIAAIVALVMIAVLGAVLIWIPLVVALVVVGALFRLFRAFGAR